MAVNGSSELTKVDEMSSDPFEVARLELVLNPVVEMALKSLSIKKLFIGACQGARR